MEECDEALLASLVLLIRQSDVEGENATSRSRRLGRDLAKDGCKLLCFTGRLVNRYISRSDRLSDVLLRLAARALLLRYAPSLSHQRADPNTEEHDSQGQPQQEYELLILTSLIETIRKRSMHSIEVEAVDVEITYVIQTLLDDLSSGNESDTSGWTKAIDALVSRRPRGGRAKNDGNSAKTIEAEDGGDEDLMTRTIRSILEAGDAEAGNDWNDAYDVAVLSCLQACSDKLAGSQFPVWNQNTMLKMVKWFQIGDSNSVRVNELILQHLHLCLFHKGSSNSNSDNIASFLMTVPDGTYDNETNTHALKSFIFYSIVAPESSATGNRLNSFRLAIQLWQSYGTDWLLDGCSQSSRNGPDLWWFKSNSTQESFGRTWPLCSLIRLAAGEFRMGLSSFISDIEDGKAPRSLAEIDSCGVIILETVQLMTSIAEDRGDLSIWTPDAILHTRKSLEDALDATVQYFTSFSEDEYIKCLSKIDEGWTEVGQTCCAVLGTIAADLELDFLFDMRRKNQDEHQHSSLFAYALRSCLLFCKSGESLGKPIQNEPLPFIIPCLLNLSSEQQSDDEATSAISILCKDDCLFLSVDDYLVHLFIQMPRESNADRFLPLIRSCLLILDMCASRMSVEMKKKLACTLKKWEGELLAQECYGEIKDLLVLCT